MSELSDAMERLAHARDLNGIMPNDAVDVILGARCETCQRYKTAKPPRIGACDRFQNVQYPNHGCLAWERRTA